MFIKAFRGESVTLHPWQLSIHTMLRRHAFATLPCGLGVLRRSANRRK
jgi:hypothetical protein